MTRPLRAATTAAVLGLTLAALTACGANGSDSGTDGDSVGLSMPFLSQEGYVIQQQLTVAAAKEAGMSMLQPTDAKQDPGKQITDVRNLITSGAKGIILTPADSAAIGPALKFAEERDVPVVAADTPPTSGKVAITVVADNALMGKLACEEMGRLLDGTGTVLELQGGLDILPGRQRTDGFNECMESEFPGIKVVEKPTQWKADKAAEATASALTQEGNLDGIYVQSDCGMLSSVLNVLKSRGKDALVGEEDHISIVSIDGCPFALESIRAKKLDAAVAQPINLYASLGVDYLRRAMAGETFEEGPTDHDSRIEIMDGNPVDLLTSPVVTAENVDDKSLFGNTPVS